MDSTWLAVALVLSALGAAWTVYAWRSRGVAAALRGAGITLLAPAAYLTGTLELAGEIAVEIGDWASGLVLSPVVWTGVGLAGAGVLLFLLGGLLAARGVGTTPRPRAVEGGTTGAGARPGTPDAAARPEVGRSRPAAAPAPRSGAPGSGAPKAADDDMDDIEAILRRRGIQ